MGYANYDDVHQLTAGIRDRLAISTETEAQALVSSASYPDCVYYTSDTHNLVKNGNVISSGIGFGTVDSTSTSTAFTATVPGITELKDGTAVMLRNNKVTSAANFTVNINDLGAKPAYSNMATGATPTRETTIFNANYTMLFVYSTTIVSGGGWICYRGYNSDNNTIGYQLRTNSTVYKASDTSRYYKIFFTSADGTHLVPASVNSTNNATAARPVNQRPIDPFGRIAYTSANTNYPAEGNIAATTLWEQYNITLGYSFNRTGAALTLTTSRPVYVKCAPQANGSAIIDADTPIVQALPSTEDGKIYIFLGIATSATAMELYVNHPVYYYKNGAIRLWTNDHDVVYESMSQSEADTGTATTGRLVSASVLATATQKRIGDSAGDWLDGDPAGILNVTPGDVSFDYDDSWQAGDDTLFLTGSSQDGVIGSNSALWTIDIPLASYVEDDTDNPGVVALGYTQNNKNYPLQLNSDGRAFVNVPWTDTTYTFDTTPTSGSTNPVTSGGVYTALSGKQNNLTFDTAPTSESTNPVTSDGIYEALAVKQDILAFDSTPTGNSTNPVTSNGIYDALMSLVIRDKTEAQALAQSVSNPNYIYYTSDSHCIVVNGQIYGRGNQITANAFAYLPASELDPSDPAFSDTTKIYIQPTSTAGVMKLWWYYNGTWINSDSQAMSVPIAAADITYDLTNTPTLGTGNVQSAIETVNATVDEGKAMASIVGLGYNLYDYISGAVNLTGFQYGSEMHRTTPSISGNCDSLYKQNTSIVYFPLMNMTGVTRLYSLVQLCSNMLVFPETTFNGSINCQNMFSGCTKLKRVGKLNGLNVNTGLYMFAGCIALERIEEVNISDMVMTSMKSTTNMFRSTSSTGSGTSVLSNLRYALLKGIGTLSAVTAYWFANARNWGVNTTAISDAKQSLLDSLYTYSYDRATAGYSNCTIHIYSSTLNALTTAEREQITAKGYILTTS